MTDRELLEAAAKAAGLKIHAARQAERDEEGCANSGLWIVNGSTCWNPLTDDGDALRLAVKLLFEIDMDCRSIAIRHQTGVKILKAFNNDPCATTRRAIVMAAAAMGKEMK
jgi:hypothetical protein